MVMQLPIVPPTIIKELGPSIRKILQDTSYSLLLYTEILRAKKANNLLVTVSKDKYPVWFDTSDQPVKHITSLLYNCSTTDTQ